MSKKRFPLKGGYLSYVLIFFFFYFTMASFTSVLSVYLTGIGKSASEASFILSAPSLFSLAVVPLVGLLCDRGGRPRLVCGALAAAVAALAVAFAQARQTWVLFLLDGALMAFVGATMPVCERLAGACKFRYGTLRVWGTFGYAAGCQAAGLALQHLPPAALFWLCAGASGLSILGFWGAEDPILPPQAIQRQEPARLSSFLRDPQFLLYLAASLVFYACSGVNMAYAPLLLDDLGMPTGAVGTVLSLGTLAEIPIILFSHKFMDRFSGKALFYGTCAVALAQYLFYGLVRSMWPVVLAMVLLKSIASTLYMMLNLKIVSNLVAPELTTTGLAVVNTANSLSTVALQNAGGLLLERFDIQTFYLLMAGLIVLTMLLLLPLRVSNGEKVFS